MQLSPALPASSQGRREKPPGGRRGTNPACWQPPQGARALTPTHTPNACLGELSTRAPPWGTDKARDTPGPSAPAPPEHASSSCPGDTHRCSSCAPALGGGAGKRNKKKHHKVMICANVSTWDGVIVLCSVLGSEAFKEH
ncbi:uncharacterized protein [Emydura macquarii macquarii]|uniref:uncharacterized protein isoform X3 n=1 Tax=Emydura macquarii macquarii TaxID=1129001 RepID=UPI00352ADA57